MDGLKLLLWKNWKIVSRNKIETAIEILAPVMIAFFPVFVRLSTDYKEIKGVTEYPPFHIKGNPPSIVRDMCHTIYYAPSHNLTDRIIEQLNQDIFTKDGLNYTFRGFAKERELVKSYKESVIGLSGLGNETTTPVLAGIIFQNIKNGADFPKHIKYTIKMPEMQRTDYKDGTKDRLAMIPSWHEDVSYLFFQKSGPRSKSNPYGGYPGIGQFPKKLGILALTTSLSRELNWTNDVLPRMDNSHFRTMMRVDHDQFDQVLNLIQNDPIFNDRNRLQFPVSVQLAIVFYRLGRYGNSVSLTNIATLFGIGDGSTITRITRRVFKAILKLEDEFIFMPDSEERKELEFPELPGCVLFMYGTHIKLEDAPGRDKESYFDKNKDYSVKLNIICDKNKRIRSYKGIYPGSVHDSQLYDDAEIGKHPENYLS